MILITGTNIHGTQELLSGVLLDSITSADYRRDVFRAFLVSAGTQELLCEMPQYHGGTGHTPEGLDVSEFTSRLRGVCSYAHQPISEASLVASIVENRIELVTINDISRRVYPAFLALERVAPPTATKVVVEMQALTHREFAEMQTFAAMEPSAWQMQGINEIIKTGTILPVQCMSPKSFEVGALKLGTQVSRIAFEAMIYHEAEKPPPVVGNALERRVLLGKRRNRTEDLEFTASIGTIIQAL